MYNPKKFPILLKELSLVFGLRKARSLIKNLALTRGDCLLDGNLFEAFVWDLEAKGYDFWLRINYRTNDQMTRLRDKRRKTRVKK